jgi:hypothetical protein
MSDESSNLLDRLRADLAGVYEGLKALWMDEAALKQEEAKLLARRERLEIAVRECERALDLDEPEAPIADGAEVVRTSIALGLRLGGGPIAPADAIDAILDISRRPLTAVEIHEKLRTLGPDVKGAETIESLRTVLTRNHKKRRWLKVGGRPAKWRKASPKKEIPKPG